MRKVFLIICLVLLYSLIFAQERQKDIETGAVKPKTKLEIIDSLKIELSKAKEDTNKVNILKDLSSNYAAINPIEGIKFGEEGLNLSQKIHWLSGEANCYNVLGNNYDAQSNYPKALEYNHKSLEIYEKIGSKLGIATILGNIGYVYTSQSDYPKALEYLNKALKINEDMGNKNNIALNLNNIGSIYRKLSDYVKALDYYHKSLEINEEIDNKPSIASNLNNIGVVYKNQADFPKALEYYLKALKLNEEVGYKSEIAGNLANIGNIYNAQSDYNKALEYYLRSLKISEELGNKSGIANIIGNIGVIYHQRSEYSKTMEYFQKALALYEELGEKYGIALYLGNIGILYQYQSDYNKALEYYHKSLEMNEILNNKQGIAMNLHNIGYLYKEKLDYPKALECYYRAININEDLGDKSGIALNYGNMGRILLFQALDTIVENSQNKNKINLNRDSIIIKAIDYTQKAIDILKETGELSEQSSFLKNISDAYSIKGDYKKAFEAFKEYKEIQDSVFSMEKQKAFANLEAKRENELKDKEIEIQAKENEILKQQSYNQTLELDRRKKEVSLLSANQQLQKLELDKRNSELNILQKDKELAELSIIAKESEAQNKGKEIELLQANEQKQKIEIKQAAYQRYALIAGLLLFALFIIIIFVRFREKKKLSDKLALQNAEIENQKSIVEEKNEQIVSSITYASTIQHAILPWVSTMQKAFSDILIYYKPKDIVSGDSYWFQEIGGIKFLAVIDCTGHGIPGAMLTVIASSVLDDAVLGKRLSDTGHILTYMNEKVTEVLNQRLAENSIRDGMEVALIAIHHNKIQFSGAGRPLYIKNGTMEIIKTDKRGIAGQTENDEYQFTSVEIEKFENLVLYISSDGYADQMNENSKKYSTKRFVSLLVEMSDKPISEQYEILENEFNSHKGERSQIDDVTILGVRI